MYTITISNDEKNMLNNLAKKRNDIKPPSTTRRKTDRFTDQEINYLGLTGEFAVCAWFGVDINRAIHKHGDGGHDLKIGNITMGVKFRHTHDGWLYVEYDYRDTQEQYYNLQSDILILTVGRCDNRHKICVCLDDHPVVRVCGWITTKDFLKKKRIVRFNKDGRDLGYKMICTQEDLNPNIHEIIC